MNYTSPQYYSVYLDFAIMPIGIILYFLIKRFSDLNVSNRGITIRNDDSEVKTGIKFDVKKLDSIIQRVEKINNSRFAVAGLPVIVDQICDVIKKENNLGSLDSEDVEEILSCLKNGSGIKFNLYKSAVCKTEKPYEEFIGRVLYDKSIKEDLFLSSKISLKKFLESCRIISLKDLNSKFQYGKSKRNLKVVTINKSEIEKFRNIETSYSRLGSLLLFMRLNGLISMMEC